MPLAPAEALLAETVRIPAAGLRLEGMLTYPEATPARRGVVLAGPHPLLGGDMTNNVVSALARGPAGRGSATLAFNYRGVGNSDGPRVDVAGRLAEFWSTSHVPGEPHFAEDLVAAVDFLREVLGDTPLALAGYSFGCSLLARAAPTPTTPLVLVAPTVGTHDHEAFAALPNPLLVVAPEGDFATDDGRLLPWFDRLTGPKRLVRGDWDDHFFRGHEGRLVEAVCAFLDGQRS